MLSKNWLIRKCSQVLVTFSVYFHYLTRRHLEYRDVSEINKRIKISQKENNKFKAKDSNKASQIQNI